MPAKRPSKRGGQPLPGPASERARAVDALTTEIALLFFRMRTAAREITGQGRYSAGRRSLLKSLARHGPRTVPAMARDRGLSRQHIQRLVNGLAADGLVELLANPAHRRSRLVDLSPRGRAAVDALERREARLMAWLARGFEPAELETARSVVRALKTRLESREWRHLLADDGKDQSAG